MKKQLRVAVLDLYEGQPNEGMRCIAQLLGEYAAAHDLDLFVQTFDVRLREEVPDLSFSIYISSGGPGSPIESEGLSWDTLYMEWIAKMIRHNSAGYHNDRKHVLFICHSFQLACRYFGTGQVIRRKSTAFGVFPIHLKASGKQEAVFAGLRDPFYAVDSRDYQVLEEEYKQRDYDILAIEKERPHVPLKRAIMAIRFNEYMIGTQFHPEADSGGMSMYLQREDKKKTVIANYGQEKWESMIRQLNDPDKIRNTYAHVIPNFLNSAYIQ